MSRLLSFLLRLGLGGVFVYAGAAKIFNPQLFAYEVDQYGLVPHAIINLVALILPWVEFICGIMVVLGVWLRASALLTGGMSGAFFLAVCSVLLRGLKIKCGCFGSVGQSFVGPSHLWLNGGCLLAAGWLVWHDRVARTPFPHKRRRI